ncbi:MAG: hypothetical protein MN733_12090, partial [Nitrososphaera sp.]|nr:hypothetical protein [Nitrososphaera sp.]
RNLAVALHGGQLLGGTNDKLAQEYSTIVGRIMQIGAVLTLDRESLIELIDEEEDEEYDESITKH